MTPIISHFRGEHGFLSNFYPSIIRIPNSAWQYPTVEHYFQAAKCPRHSNEHEAIMLANTPKDAKMLGRRLKIRKDWDDIKIGIMLAGLNYKFQTHASLRRKLLDTGDAILVEGNTWNDRFWGASIIEDEFIGLNMLGVLLMHVRQKLNGGFETRYREDD